MRITLEVIATSLADIAAAEQGGANRIELCQGLSEGALTPSLGFMHAARRATALPIAVIIRPRGGDQVYTPDEVELMESDIWAAREARMDGIVLCPMTREGALDLPVFMRLARAAAPMEVVCARPVDMAGDLFGAVQAFASVPNATRVLTAGGPGDTEAHKGTVRDLVDLTAGHLQIMTGVGLTPENVGRLVRATGVSEVHVGWGCRTPPSFTGANDVQKIARIRDELNQIEQERSLAS